jgi:hypothetical protein
MSSQTKDPNHCVETGNWTPIPNPPPPGSPLVLSLEQIDAKEAKLITDSQVMTFHSVGCSGDFDNPNPGAMVAQAMVMELSKSKQQPASFLFHLGDIVYKHEEPSNGDPPAAASDDPKPDDKQAKLYKEQFYKQYADYPKQIFAIAGNHDGKSNHHAIDHFLDNFCNAKREDPQDDPNANRQTMTQPYPYWVLETPVAHIIGLYTNVANGGLLDEPNSPIGPNSQLTWLTNALLRIKQANDSKAIVLTLHYPVYSGAANFAKRGDPNATRPIPSDPSKPTDDPHLSGIPTLANLLQTIFSKTQCFPDIVLSAHAHLYQRITYTDANNRQIPFLIVGCGGHFPIEQLSKACDGDTVPLLPVPFPCVPPDNSTLPDKATAMVVAYDDSSFGFLRIRIDLKAKQISGKFFSIGSGDQNPKINLQTRDSFKLDLSQHVIS